LPGLQRGAWIGMVGSVHGLAVHVAPCPVEIVEAMVLFVDDDDVVELVDRQGRGARNLRGCGNAHEGRKSGRRASNVHDFTPTVESAYRIGGTLRAHGSFEAGPLYLRVGARNRGSTGDSRGNSRQKGECGA